MAQSSKIWVKDNDPLKEEEVKLVDTVSICSMVDAIIKVTGTVTGRKYVFTGAGSVQQVDSRDKDELLNKKRGKSCCGGNSGKTIFQLV